MKERLIEFNKIKELISKYIYEASCGIYDTRNTVGDIMYNLYDGNLSLICVMNGHILKF